MKMKNDAYLSSASLYLKTEIILLSLNSQQSMYASLIHVSCPHRQTPQK
jgi:hypothetical protein